MVGKFHLRRFPVGLRHFNVYLGSHPFRRDSVHLPTERAPFESGRNAQQFSAVRTF